MDFRRVHFDFRLDFGLRFVLVVLFVRALDFALALGFTRSGSFAVPVERFHSSKVSLEILPWTRSSANFLRWAWLLNGIFFS